MTLNDLYAQWIDALGDDDTDQAEMLEWQMRELDPVATASLWGLRAIWTICYHNLHNVPNQPMLL